MGEDIRMKQWAKAHGFSYARLATDSGQTPGNVNMKMNGRVPWQSSDCRSFYLKYGLDPKFLLGLDLLTPEVCLDP